MGFCSRYYNFRYNLLLTSCITIKLFRNARNLKLDTHLAMTPCYKLYEEQGITIRTTTQTLYFYTYKGNNNNSI